MKTGIILFEQFHGRENIGSSRIRGHWIAKYWEDCEVAITGKKYDQIIYQKVYWPEHAKNFKGKKILDMCDPDWLHWSHRVKEMIEEVDAITTSTEALRIAIQQFTDKPVYYVADRLDLDVHRERKVHEGRAKLAVWFGYSSNSELVKPLLNILDNYNLDLKIISDKDFNLPNAKKGKINLINTRWNPETINRELISGDIILNPRSSKGRWRFKSNNKTLSAWSLGMPVADNLTDLKRFLDEDERKKESQLRLKEVKEKWDVRKSVDEYKKIFESINK